ncbi:MAG: Holliday junction branch migration protein RuvA [Thermodesulfobacteriota bacterium]
MIGYLEGKILKKGEERILLLCNQVGYEVLLPGFVMETLRAKMPGDTISLYIHYQQTERQPTPVLIGFNSELEKAFFHLFITVEAIGPLKAVKALNLSMDRVAEAIESKDADTLKNLKGIGARTAQKIIATLSGRMASFLSEPRKQAAPVAESEDFILPVQDVLVEQLGHKPADAKRMIAEALERNSGISSPEALFEEIYRGDMAH